MARQADAVTNKNFWLLYAATIIAGYYSVNANVYHFAAAEIANPAGKGKRHQECPEFLCIHYPGCKLFCFWRAGHNTWLDAAQYRFADPCTVNSCSAFMALKAKYRTTPVIKY